MLFRRLKELCAKKVQEDIDYYYSGYSATRMIKKLSEGKLGCPPLQRAKELIEEATNVYELIANIHKISDTLNSLHEKLMLIMRDQSDLPDKYVDSVWAAWPKYHPFYLPTPSEEARLPFRAATEEDKGSFVMWLGMPVGTYTSPEFKPEATSDDDVLAPLPPPIARAAAAELPRHHSPEPTPSEVMEVAPLLTALRNRKPPQYHPTLDRIDEDSVVRTERPWGPTELADYVGDEVVGVEAMEADGSLQFEMEDLSKYLGRR
jgi:hypothetical protein